MTGDGIDLDNNSATVAINGGTIGNTNDPGGIGVDINGGSASVTIAASVTKTTAGDIVEVTGRTGGTVTLSGNLSATGAVSNGIDVNSNTGGTINFTGADPDADHRRQHRRQSREQHRRHDQLQRRPAAATASTSPPPPAPASTPPAAAR